MNFLEKMRSLSWTKILSTGSTIVVRVVLMLLSLLLLFVILRGLKQDGYSIQSFQMPKNLQEAGYNGEVVGYLLQDQVKELKILANSQREDSLDFTLEIRPELNLEVMGVGLSATSMIVHLRELLGRKTYSISGNIIDIDNTISMNVRMTGFPTISITRDYKTGESSTALKELIEEGAIYVLKNTDPYRLAVVYQRKGQIEASENLIRQIIKDRPKDRKWAYTFWGNLKLQQGDKTRAFQHFKKAIEVDPKFTLPMRSLAWGLFRDKEYTEALKYFLMILEINPMEQSMDTGAALCYRELGETNKAGMHYESFIQKFPDLIWAYGNYSDFLINYKKDTVRATEIWELASRNLEESGDYYLAMAAFYSMKIDTTRALEYMHQALELEPDHVGALQQMVNYYMRELKDYATAEEYATKLTKSLDTQDYDIQMRVNAYNILAIAEYHQSKFDSSIVHVREAIRLMPENPFPWSTLAEIYILKGDLQAFYSTIEKAIELDFKMENYIDSYPYNLIKDQSRLKLLISNHKKEYSLLD